jgi:hypothetical protein
MEPLSSTGKLGFGIAVFVTVLVGVLIVVGLSVGAAFGCAAYNRYQKRADANNQVRVTSIQRRNAVQRVDVAKIENELKHQQAIGQRKANEEISSRLTPLFVQYEALQAMVEAAHSGAATIIYYPVGANGVPLISTTNKPQVYEPTTKP